MLSRLRAIRDRDPDRLAIASGSGGRTFGELVRDVEVLARQIPEGTVVAGMLDSGAEFTVVHLATLTAGAVFLPLPPTAKAPEITRAFGAVAPDVVITRREIEPEVTSARFCAPGEPLPTLEKRPTLDKRKASLPEDTRMVQLTSGSTGLPKGIVVSEEAIEVSLDHSASFLERFDGRAVFSPMPQFHAMGGAVVLEHLAHGASVLVSNRFVPGDDRRRMAEAQVGLAIGSPSYFRMLLRLGMFRGGKLSCLNAVCLGSAPADPTLVGGLREALPTVRLHIRYGLSETFGALTRLDVEADEALPAPGLVGPPLGSVELRPLPPPAEDGAPEELRVRGNSIARWAVVGEGDCRALQEPDGFFPTGDLGYCDERGVHLRGRKSEFIKRLGFRIDPGEIEQTLLSRPDIAEAVVVGIHDDLSGCTIVAVVEGNIDGDAGELAEYCRERLSDHKVPQRFEVVAQVPRTPSGKPDRARIRENLTAGVNTDVD